MLRPARSSIFNDGAWLPVTGSYPPGTPLERATQPFHDGNPRADVFWGASVHWNTYLEQYVMLLNRSKDENFGTEGIYVSYSTSLSDPERWTAPQKLMSGGEWYPQAVGIESGVGHRPPRRKAGAIFSDGEVESDDRVRTALTATDQLKVES